MASMFQSSAIEQMRTATASSLDVYELSVRAYADVYERVGRASNVVWVQNLTRVQAEVLRATASTYTRTVRALLR